MTAPLPGSFGLSVIDGKAGGLVAAGQALTGDGSRYTHAFLVLDKGEIIEAMPSGARIIPLADRIDDDGGVVFSDKPVQDWLALIEKRYPDVQHWTQHSLEETVRGNVVEYARSLVGTPYNFLDYVYLSLAHFKIRANWLRKRIQNQGHLICSQLVDEVYRANSIHLFNDGRLPMDVTPGDLDYYRNQ
jgi:uncharacterized protein YycO